MKILHTVQRYHPHKGGSEEVVRQLSERLAAKGHEVTVATGTHPERPSGRLNGVEIRSFDVQGNLAFGIKGQAEAYRRFLSQANFEVMLNYAAQIWSTDLVFDLLDDLPRGRALVPCGYNLTDERLRTYFSQLPGYLSKYDALVYMSENYQDKAFGDRNGLGDRAVIIPNGASAEEFDAPSPSFKTHFGVRTPLLVLTVSNHYNIKGHRRIIEAFKSLRRDDVSLIMIGEPENKLRHGCYAWCRLESWKDSRIRVLTGLERKWVVAAYKQADLFVLGSEIECAPLVIYEAMAAGVPFLSTNCGNVNDNRQCGVVVDDPGMMGAEMAKLLADAEARAKLGKMGRARWTSAHTWDRIVDAYEALYTQLAASA